MPPGFRIVRLGFVFHAGIEKKFLARAVISACVEEPPEPDLRPRKVQDAAQPDQRPQRQNFPVG